MHYLVAPLALAVLTCAACGGHAVHDPAAAGGTSGAGGARQGQAGSGAEASAADGGRATCDGHDAGALTGARTFDVDKVEPTGLPRSLSVEPAGLVRCGGELCLAGELGGRLRLDQDLVAQGAQDAYLAKLALDGTPVWSRRIGGTTSTDRVIVTSIAAGPEGGLALSVACAGQIALLAADGSEASLDCAGSDSRVYLLKLDVLGKLLWSIDLGTSWLVPVLASVAIDASDRTVVTAHVGNSIRSAGKDPDRALVAAFAPDGTGLFRHSFEGSISDPSVLAIDSAGNAVLTGFFDRVRSFDGDVAPASATLLGRSGSSMCVLKLDVTGALTWSHCFAGTNQQAREPNLALGSDDSIVLAGTFGEDLDFSVVGEGANPSDARLSSLDAADAYVAKFDAAGTLMWQRQLGGKADQSINHVSVAAQGYVITSGVTRDALSIDGFEITGNAWTPFVAGFDSDGRAYFLTRLGRSAYLLGKRSITTGSCRSFYLAADYWGDLMAPGRTSNPAVGLTLVIGAY